VAASHEELRKRVDRALQRLADDSCRHIHDVGGIYYAATDLLRGGTIYERCVETKPPGAYFGSAAGLALSGGSLDGPVRAHAVWQAMGAAAMVFLGAWVAGPAVGALAGLLYALFHVHPAVTGLCGTFAAWAVPPTIASYAAFRRARELPYETDYGRGRAWDFAAGALAAVAVSMKQTAVLSFVGVPVWWVWHVWKHPGQRVEVRRGIVRGRLFSPAGAYLGGAVAVGLAFLAFYVIRGGVLDAFLALRPGRVLGYLGTTPLVADETVRERIVQFGSGFWPLFVLAAFGLRTRGAGLALVWLGGAALGVAAGSKYFLHYFTQVVAPLCLLGALGAFALARALPSRALAAGVVAALAIAGTGPSLTLAARAAHLRATTGAWQPFRALEGPAWPWGGAPIRDRDLLLQREHRRVGAYLAARTHPTDPIFVWDYAPEIHAYADRRAPTRHYMYWDTTVAHPYGWHPVVDDVVVSARAELMMDLREDPPAYIVAFGLGFARRLTVKPFFPDLEVFVRTHYARVPERVAGHIVLYRRIEHVPASAKGAER